VADWDCEFLLLHIIGIRQSISSSISAIASGIGPDEKTLAYLAKVAKNAV
jgi:hypothetical protein